MSYSCAFFFLLLMVVMTHTQIITTKEPTAAPTVPGQLYPFLTCWFSTYRHQNRFRNVVMGYSSSFAGTVTRGEGLSQLFINVGAVASIDVNALTSFPPGRNASLFYVNDVITLKWQLNETLLFINVNELENDTLCTNLFAKVCAPDDGGDIAHFCEDGSFCNGEEVCVDELCQPSATVPCTSGQHCNEVPPRCETEPEQTASPLDDDDASNQALFVSILVFVAIAGSAFLLICFLGTRGQKKPMPVTARNRRVTTTALK